jgi:hypothetical protein
MRTIIVPATLVAVLAAAAAGAAASPISDLTGYWMGGGTIILSKNQTEKVRCAVTYKVLVGETRIRQNVRCASQDYAINASADLEVRNGQVSGSWEEKTYSATGEVSGRYTGSVFLLNIRGANFTADMKVGLSTCRQQIDIVPRGLEMRRVSIGLAKC